MSARCVIEVATAQSLFHSVVPGRSSTDSGSFAQSLHLDLETTRGVLSQPRAADGSPVENVSSIAKGINKNLIAPSSELQSEKVGYPVRFEAKKPDVSAATLNEQGDLNNGEEVGMPEQENNSKDPAGRSISAQVQHSAARDVGGNDASNIKKSNVAPAASNANLKQGISPSKEKQRTSSFAIASTNSIESGATSSPAIQFALQYPATAGEIFDGGLKKESIAASPAVQPNSSEASGGAPSPRVSRRSAPQGTAVNVDAPKGTDATGRILTEQAQAELGKRDIASVAVEPGSGDLKVSVSASMLSKLETNRIAETSAVVLMAVPPAAIAGSQTNQIIHPSDAGTHAASLLSGLEEPGTFSTDYHSINGLPRLLLTTSTALEVGVQSETHGWLKVRAELTETGTVNASLAAASSVSQATLHRELPGLTAYLQAEKLPVNAIVVHSIPVSGSESGSSATAKGEGSGGQTQQEDGRRQQREHGFESTGSDRLNGGDIDEGWNGNGQENLPGTQIHSEGRSWLSVRA